jgi:hypothetical protein
MIGELLKIAGHCDGARCDMAMLVLPEVFERIWGFAADTTPVPPQPAQRGSVRRRRRIDFRQAVPVLFNPLTPVSGRNAVCGEVKDRLLEKPDIILDLKAQAQSRCHEPGVVISRVIAVTIAKAV